MLVSFAINSVFAQVEPQAVFYTYDEAGNRTVREIRLTIIKTTEKSAIAKNEEQTLPFMDKSGSHDITIYPNPTKGNLLLEIGQLSSESEGNIDVFDINGRAVIGDISISRSRTKINLSNEPPGVYFMSLNLDGKTTTWKIIKE